MTFNLVKRTNSFYRRLNEFRMMNVNRRQQQIISIAVFMLTGLFMFLVFRNEFGQYELDESEYQLNLTKKNYELYKSNVVGYLLHDPNEFILAYVNLPFNYDYGSLLIPLVISTLLTDGDILELGMGYFSTPVLHKISLDYNRRLVSVDTDASWTDKFAPYTSTLNHRIFRMRSLDELNRFGLDRRWGLVLVDHKYLDNRPLNVINFANISTLVVAHDTEIANEAGYEYEKNRITDYYKYKCKFSLYDKTKINYVSTTILSNYLNLENILKPIFAKVTTEYGHEACKNGY